MADVIFVTGVSTGLGHALAAAYLDTGAIVLGTGRNCPDDLVTNKDFHFVHCDLREHCQIEARLFALLRDFKQIDLVVLNAGVHGGVADMAETSLAQVHDVMDVNVWPNKVILDFLIHGRFTVRQVVGISSGASHNAHRGWNAYALSKSALNMLLQLYAAEMPDTHFCALAPGLVDTPMQQQLCAAPDDPRYPSVNQMKTKRGTPAMPSAEACAAQLLRVIPALPEKVESGSFADVRTLEV